MSRRTRRPASGAASVAAMLSCDALEWIEHVGDRPYFLWVHLYDAHRPYDPPKPYATTYAHNLYVGEIAFADSQVGRLTCR